ncbi:MAG: 2-oxo acid dehydrogenase subunit E2 [Polyangiaceae bacterium]
MPLFRRSDGDVIDGLPLVRRIMPFLMRGRNESVVYHDTVYVIASARAWLEAFNRARPGRPPATLFHLFLWACARALHERPGLNRFVSGGRVYQRRGVFLSFAAKRAFRDDAPIATCKVEFPARESFVACVDRVVGSIGESRSDKERPVDKELKITFAFPTFLIGLGVKLLMWLDRMNLMPAAMIRSDPMYASLFAANLGSVGIDDVTHHLYEYGNVSLFGAMGTAGPQVMPGPDGTVVVRDAVKVRWSFDERINDGFYCASSLRLVREVMEDPQAVLGPPTATVASAEH